MGVQPETYLQQRIQRIIEKRGGYCHKNHGSMISEPGIADITCCYKGIYIALECKIGDNKPSPQQGVHSRKVWKAGGMSFIVWSTEQVEQILDTIDFMFTDVTPSLVQKAKHALVYKGIDTGSSY